MNISSITLIVYQPKIFGIGPQFIWFHLVQHQIVHTEMNTITYPMVEHLTLYHNLKGSNPATGAGKEKIRKKFILLNLQGNFNCQSDL